MKILEFWLATVVVGFPFSLLVGRMARSYHRSSGAWFLLSVLFTPITSLVFLLVANIPHSSVVLGGREERVREQHPEIENVHDVALNEMPCPECGTQINPVTGDGLRSPDDEPWRLRCVQCGTEIEPT